MATAGVHRVLERTQVPTESTVRSGDKESNSRAASNGIGDELLGCAAYPAQHEQCMLAGDVLSPPHPGDRFDCYGVVSTTVVGLGGLSPDRFGDLTPAQRPLQPLTIHSLEKGAGVEVSYPSTSACVTSPPGSVFGGVAHAPTL